MVSQGPGIFVTDLGGNDDCSVSSVMLEVIGPDQKIETFGFSSDSVSPAQAIHGLQYGRQGGAYRVRAFGEYDDEKSRTEYSNIISWGVNAGARAWTNFEAPINVRQVDIDSTKGVSLSWEEPDPQAEYYSVRCFLSTEPDFISPVYCAASNPVAAVDKIPPKTEFAALTTLKPSTLYKCYVIAMDSDHWKCSDPVFVDYQNYGTCEPYNMNEEIAGARLATCGTKKATVQDAQGSRAAQQEAYGFEIVDMSGTTIQRKIESFPGATIPLHFNICMKNSTEASKVDDDVISKQIEVINQAFAETKITFTKGETVSCTDEEKELVEEKCMPDIYADSLLEDQDVLDFLSEYGLPATWENALIAAVQVCAERAFATLDGVTDLARGITNFVVDTVFFFRGISPSIGLYNATAEPFLLIVFGSLPGMESPFFDLGGGMTLSHEMGHLLGLPHPWDEPRDLKGPYTDITDGEEPNFCLDARDPMPSTPFTREAVYQCNVGSDTCPTKPGRDPINNIMSYSDECCMSVFTMEQIVLMQANILTYAPFWLN